MKQFKFLYSFSCTELTLVEIKISGVPEGSPLSDIYKWLFVPASTNDVLELDFKSMEKGETEETREFLEGSLKFNSSAAELRFLGRTYQLKAGGSDLTAPKISSFLNDELFNSSLCSFRKLKPSDLKLFEKWISDPEVIRYSMTQFHRMTSPEQIREWYLKTLFDSKCFQFGIIDSETKSLVGYAGIASINEIDGNGEYFILIGEKDHWGRGIASTVTKEIVSEGFRKLGLHRIFLTASSSNPGALRAYEKAGFVLEGRMREAFFRNEQYSDKVFMGIFKEEYTSF